MESMRKATPRQLAYIQQLREREGKESIELDENLGFEDASRMIKEMLGSSTNNNQGQSVKINEPRLGMVMKECYRYFRTNQKSIHYEHREVFKKEVIKTYDLFTEIAQDLGQRQKPLKTGGATENDEERKRQKGQSGRLPI